MFGNLIGQLFLEQRRSIRLLTVGCAALIGVTIYQELRIRGLEAKQYQNTL